MAYVGHRSHPVVVPETPARAGESQQPCLMGDGVPWEHVGATRYVPEAAKSLEHNTVQLCISHLVGEKIASQ